ncbi:uncharacterized protein LOC118766644 [Octopus sinensis]|uniref:Uncharacterized protein LOC118766644 n=1 Tax=Octopus sinensis TaxID=2607531 RepID=A0A7E6FEB7_9MOLL|nr:uncharacterized protein LOC118766644 [Octopus sinensis]
MQPTMNMKIHFVLYFALYLFVICCGVGDESYYNRSKFIKVTNATIEEAYFQKRQVNDSEMCAGLCYLKHECNSFVFYHSEETCELYKRTTATRRLITTSNADFYQSDPGKSGKDVEVVDCFSYLSSVIHSSIICVSEVFKIF